MTLALLSFVAGIAARHFGQSPLVAGNRRLWRKLFPSANS